MAILQTAQPFRHESGEPPINLVLLPDSDEEDFVLHQIEAKNRAEDIYVPVEQAKLTRVDDGFILGLNVVPWFTENYLDLVIEQAEQEDISLWLCARKYGVLSLVETTRKWCFHPALGFYSDFE